MTSLTIDDTDDREAAAQLTLADLALSLFGPAHGVELHLQPRGSVDHTESRSQEGSQAMDSAIEFATARLRLRVWRDADRAPFAELNADPRVMRHFPSTQDRAASDASIDAWTAQFAERGWSNWAVELLATGEFVGFVGLTVPRRALPFSPCVEIGWRLAHAFWGRGYASEAARGALRVGFEQIGLEEIVSFTAVVNAPSRAVMARIGMHDADEDFEHRALPKGHALRRHCLYRLGREEWQRSAMETG